MLLNKDVNISTCYEAAGAFTYGKLHAALGSGEKRRTPSDVMVSAPTSALELPMTERG